MEQHECLDDATLATIADGGLAPDERAPIERHLVACDACQALLAAVVRSLREESAASGVRRGATIDRYVVQRWLGSGAAGSVYEAHDPVLDRRVAIKILGAPIDDAPAEERAAGGAIDEATLREARAMARLSHPNVVPVHDVGIAAGRAFLVMERIEGTTLRAWLGERARDWRAIVDAFAQAGRGLAAAHAAGLVHRDFKPDNVLVARERVLVSDFGLSRAFDAPAIDDARGVTAATRATTATSLARGTPAYMAPEQQAGERATPASDQYAFCVALHEALSGRLPDDGGALPRRAGAPGAIPAALRAVIARGLERDPARRHESMDALLRRLARVRARARRAQIALASLGVVVATIVAYAAWLSPAALERAAERRLAGAWDASRKAAVHEALRATGSPVAEPSWRIVERELDRYAREWTLAYAPTLRPHALRGRLASARDDAARACLDERRAELAAMVDLLARADRSIVERANDAVFQLGSVSACAATATRAGDAPAPGDADKSAHVRALLVDARAQHALGRFAAAEEEARAALAEARALGNDGLASEALYGIGDASGRAGRVDDATRSLHEAAWTAEAARNDTIVLRAWTALVFYVGVVQQRADEAHVIERHAEAALARLGDAPVLESMLRANVASLRKQEGRLAEALDEETRVIALRERVYAADDPRVAMMLANRARTRRMLGRFEEAAADQRRAVAALERTFGPEDAMIANVLSSLAITEARLGELDAATRDAERALAMRRARFGEEHYETAASLDDVGVVADAAGRAEDAERALRLAVATRERLFGAKSAPVAESRMHLAHALLAANRAADALPIAEAASAQYETSGATPTRAAALVVLGRARAATGDRAGAIADLARAVDLSTQSLGAEHPDTGIARRALDEARRAAGDAFAEAVR